MKALHFQSHELRVAVKACQVAGSMLTSAFVARDYLLDSKPDRSVVTSADREAEDAIIGCIREAFPSDQIEAEERGYLDGDQTGRGWLVDPLDGTDNFVTGIPYFGVSVCFRQDALAVAAAVLEPLTKRQFSAVRGGGAWVGDKQARVSSSDALDAARVAFIPGYETKGRRSTLQIRELLMTRTRRVLDTWAPSLDWAMLAGGYIDAIVAVTAHRPREGAGSLLVGEGGGVVSVYPVQRLGERQDSTVCIAANGVHLRDELETAIARRLGESMT